MSVLAEEEFPKMALPTKIPSSSLSHRPTAQLLTPPASLPDSTQFLKPPGSSFEEKDICAFETQRAIPAGMGPSGWQPEENEMNGWLRDNAFHHGAFPLHVLASTVKAKGLQVTVIVPAKEVASTIGGVLENTINPLVDANIVSKVYAIDAESKDGTGSVAARHGATVLQRAQITPELGSSLGKGDAMWRSLVATSTGSNSEEIIAFLDGDTGDPTPSHLIGIIGPLIMNEKLQLVKGCFERPFKSGSGELRANDGGRVTELAARPMLNIHFPKLAVFSQPLAGEFAARRGLLEQLAFPVGYGIEVGTLIDSLRLVGLPALAQSDLGTRQNEHKALRDLSTMAFAVTSAVERRLGRSQLGDPGATNRFEDSAHIPPSIYLPWECAYRTVSDVERPPIKQYRADILKFQQISMALPCPPFVIIEGVRNFRDIGGCPTSAGRCTRRGLVYRSGDLRDSTANLEDTFNQLDIKAVFDLRSGEEVDKARSNGGREEGYEVMSIRPAHHHVPIFEDENYSPEALAARFKDYASEGTQGFERAYALILSNASKALLAIFNHLSVPDPTPMLMHCTAGKDRTGVIAMTLLLLAGCSPATIAKEYSLTEAGLGEAWRAETVARLVKHPAFEGEDTKGIERMVGAREEVMLAVIRNLERDFGGVEGYLAAMGIEGWKAEKVKAVLQEVIQEPGSMEF